DSTIKLWRAGDGKLLRTITGRSVPPNEIFGPFIPLVFSPDGQFVSAIGEGSGIGVWRVSDGTLRFNLPPFGGSTLAFSPDGQLMAAGQQSGAIRVFRAADGTMVRTLSVHTEGVSSLVFSPDS